MTFQATSGTATDALSSIALNDDGMRLGAAYALLNEGTKVIRLGGLDMSNTDTTKRGFPLYPGKTFPITLNGPDRIYLLCAAGESSPWVLLKQDN